MAATPVRTADSGSGDQGRITRPTGRETVLVLDFGGQTAQLIARRVREAGVFSLLIRPDAPLEEIRAHNPSGIILSGGPKSVYEPGAPTCDPGVLTLGVPVLGICYGMQLVGQFLGMKVSQGGHREFGRAEIEVRAGRDGGRDGVFASLPEKTVVWMSHGDQVMLEGAPPGVAPLVRTLASTGTCPLAAMSYDGPLNGAPMRFIGVQFHPEVTHTPQGSTIIENFLYEVCRCKGEWRMADYLEEASATVREKVGEGRVICGLSGGVDSSVVAALLHRAIGDRLTCVFVDNGLLRKNERQSVETMFRDHFRIDLRVVDASAAFLGDLAGVTEPQEKRRRIGHRFIEVFNAEAAKVVKEKGGGEAVKFLAQGTLYPDVIESGHSTGGSAAGIKLHHNVGGLPADLEFSLIEPLRELFKDEARRLGEVLGLPEKLVWRHPFPGPGLAVRCLGEVTGEKLDVLRECDTILLEEIVAADLYKAPHTSQVFAVLLPVKSVGVMGDGRTYDSCVALRAVTTEDFMTADWARLPYDVLARISNRIINEVRGVNRVVYDISSKPPATIEWE